MQTFILLTRVDPESLHSPDSFEKLEQMVIDRIRSECPEVTWLANYAILGPWDYLDIFSAPDNETAMKVSSLIRTFGHARAEIWAATEWQRFKELMHELPAAAA